MLIFVIPFAEIRDNAKVLVRVTRAYDYYGLARIRVTSRFAFRVGRANTGTNTGSVARNEEGTPGTNYRRAISFCAIFNYPHVLLARRDVGSSLAPKERIDFFTPSKNIPCSPDTFRFGLARSQISVGDRPDDGR